MTRGGPDIISFGISIVLAGVSVLSFPAGKKIDQNTVYQTFGIH